MRYLKWSAVNPFKFKRNITASRLRIEITVTVGYFVATSTSWSYANICMWCIALRGERGRNGRREAKPTQSILTPPPLKKTLINQINTLPTLPQNFNSQRKLKGLGGRRNKYMHITKYHAKLRTTAPIVNIIFSLLFTSYSKSFLYGHWKIIVSAQCRPASSNLSQYRR